MDGSIGGWGEMPEFLRMLAALLFVLGLMGGLVIALKKMGLNGAVEAAPKQKRLRVIEALALDARRRLVLIQRDDVQHLVILGANEETVIETGIKPQDNDTHAN